MRQGQCISILTNKPEGLIHDNAHKGFITQQQPVCLDPPKVHRTLTFIPVHKVTTYRELAAAYLKPTAERAVHKRDPTL